MTISDNGSVVREDDPFAPLYPYAFVNLMTFRKSGEAVPTTIWFAPDDQGRIYLVTQVSTGKVRRMRANPAVQMVPSDARGTVLDRQIVATGHARELSAEQRDYAIAMLTKKYGEEYTSLMESTNGSHSPTRVYFEIAATNM